MSDNPAIRHLMLHLSDLFWRDYLQELFTTPDRLHVTKDDTGRYTVTSAVRPYPGKLVVYDGFFQRVEGVARGPGLDQYYVTFLETDIPDTGGIILSPRTAFTLQPGSLSNFMNGDPILTSVGRVVVNYLILDQPFDGIIPYINTVWKASEIEKIVGDAIISKRVTTDQVNRYINNLLFIGHTPEICSPNLTEKSLTTDPKIASRKQELLEENKEALAAGDAVVMSQIENELIGMDRTYLKGDESMNYLLGSKQFDVIRKKMYVVHGMVESFGDKGQYAFVENSLQEGWTQDSFPTIANEIRAGSYARAKETAKGGEESKFILRIFQNTRVTERDCGSTKTLDVNITQDNSAEYLYRNYIDESSEIYSINSNNHQDFIGKRVRFRSPMYCTAEGGYCYKCIGTLFESLDQNTMATVMNNIGAQMTVLSLKQSHGGKVSTVEVNDLNKFLVK